MKKDIKLANNFILKISQASIDDAEDIVEFLNIVGGETDFLTFGAEEFPFSVAEEKEIIRECLEQNMCLMLIGKIDNQIVSQLYLQCSKKPRLEHIGDLGISVFKKYWGLSIGKHMMLAAIEWAKNNGITKLQLQVRTDNDRAIQLYKKLGFAIEGTITRALKIGDIYFDEYRMGLELH